MLVLILLVLLIILIIFFLFFLLSSLKINIITFKFDNEKNINLKYKIEIAFYLFGKIKLFKKVFRNKNVTEMQLINTLEKVNLYKIKEFIRINKKYIKRIDINLEKLKLDLFIGTEDILITNILVSTFIALITTGIVKFVKQYNKNKIKFKIIPVYLDKNLFNISIKTKLNIKILSATEFLWIIFKNKLKRKQELKLENALQ